MVLKSKRKSLEKQKQSSFLKGTDQRQVPCEYTQGWNNSHDSDTTELLHSFVISAALVHPWLCLIFEVLSRIFLN